MAPYSATTEVYNMNDKNRIYKYILIYIYLLVIIAFIMYRYPGLVDYHENQDIKYNKLSHEEYVLGAYLKDKDKFDVSNMHFPVAVPGDMEDYIYYSDSYGADRTYGGDRVHEGCDIMTVHNTRGELPIVSVCDGVIEKIGWLELGGYRVGIRSESGVYYYYAHLYDYADNIREGDTVSAGQIIGYIGDTGYSKVEGTTGNFAVHLHFGIYVYDKAGNEYTLNPFPLLKGLEESVIKYTINCSYK